MLVSCSRLTLPQEVPPGKTSRSAMLDLYHLPPNPLRPLVCVDESHKEQRKEVRHKEQRKEVRHPEPMEPGKPARYDHEYKHNGMSNLFMMFAPHHNWRHVKVTES